MLEGSRQLGRGRYNRYILIVCVRERPVALAKGDIDDKSLCCTRRFEDQTHERKDIMRHTRTVSNYTTADRLGKDGCNTKKGIVGLKKFTNDCDNTVRYCIRH